MTTLIQILVTIALIQYLGAALALGRPRLTEKLSNKNDGGLRDYFFALSPRRLKRHEQMMSRDGTKAILGEAMEYRHLQRIKRDLDSNPCFKTGSLKSITLSDNSSTFSVECLESTITGCFHNIPAYTTTLCTKSMTFFPQTGQSVVQGCSCA